MIGIECGCKCKCKCKCKCECECEIVKRENFDTEGQAGNGSSESLVFKKKLMKIKRRVKMLMKYLVNHYL
jgi:hypothetical protein